MEANFGILVIAVGVAVELAKALGLDKKFCPALSLALGVVANIFLGTLGVDLQTQVIGGLILGATTAGLYDAVKKPVNAVKSFVVSKFPKA